ncbi:MAG: hypothetical protein J0M04_01445 [Verrucomicrobia bacterium]|nr:hypothetical protein [Verrucomicrobiota bacterium]
MKRPRTAILAATAAVLVAGGLGLWWSWHPGKAGSASGSQTLETENLKLETRPPLHPAVARIVGEGPAMPYLRFFHLLKEIPTDLAEHDIAALLDLVSGPAPEAFRETEWGSLANDIEEALTVQTRPSATVARGLRDIYRDESRPRIQRDYALQHIGGFAIFLVRTRDDPMPEASREILDSLLADLRHAASDPSKPWAGTSLNLLDGILRAAESRSIVVRDLDPAALVALALPIAGNPSLPLNARLPALQLAGRHRSPEAAALARSFLADPASPVMLVQCSAAVLGQGGSRNDLPLLEDALASASRHTAPALREAIRSLSPPQTHP